MPDMTQARKALAIANEVRLERAQVKRDLRDGRLTVAEAMDRPCCATMSVESLLAAQHRWGTKRAGRTLSAVSINPARRLGALTDRQRAVLLAAL